MPLPLSELAITPEPRRESGRSRKSFGGSRLVWGALMRLSQSANKRQELPQAPCGSREASQAGGREDPLRHALVAARWLTRQVDGLTQASIRKALAERRLGMCSQARGRK